MEEVGVFLVFVYICIPRFKETLLWYFVSFVNFLYSLHDVFMCMVHEIFLAIFETKEIRFCSCINVATEAHGEILNIIASFDGDVNESTNPVIV